MKPVRQVTRRFLVWIVAGIAAFQVWVQAVAETFNHRLDLFVVWLGAGVIIFGAVALVEKVNAPGVE